MNTTLNYQKQLEQIISRIESDKIPPTLFLHSCCAPCSSYVIEYLAEYFSVTVFYFNPNISPREEYARRAKEQQKLITQLPAKYPVSYQEGIYNPSSFDTLTRGLENEPEGGKRCTLCYTLRLKETASLAAKGNFDYFTTTLSVSPYKDAHRLNAIGQQLSKQFGIQYLPSDFKKKEGYKRSIQLSKQYGLYRQDYCGCRFSKR